MQEDSLCLSERKRGIILRFIVYNSTVYITLSCNYVDVDVDDDVLLPLILLPYYG